MYALISEVQKDVEDTKTLIETVESSFGDVDSAAVFESLQSYLQPAIAAAKSGKHPFGGKGARPVVDPQTVAGIHALIVNPEAFNVTSSKFAAIDRGFDDNQKVRELVRKAGARANDAQEKMQSMSAEQLGKHLQKLQMRIGRGASAGKKAA